MARYSNPYARRGDRDSDGRLMPDMNAPRNWEHPYWRERAEQAMTRAANYMRDAVGDEGAQALSDAFNARVPDDWMESQPWRHLALCAEALSSYLFQFALPGAPEGSPTVDDMVRSYRTAKPVRPKSPWAGTPPL